MKIYIEKEDGTCFVYENAVIRSGFDGVYIRNLDTDDVDYYEMKFIVSIKITRKTRK